MNKNTLFTRSFPYMILVGLAASFGCESSTADQTDPTTTASPRGFVKTTGDVTVEEKAPGELFSDEESDHFFDKAERHLAAGKCLAAIHLAKGFQRQKDDPRAHWILGNCDAQLGDTPRAVERFTLVANSPAASPKLRARATEGIKKLKAGLPLAGATDQQAADGDRSEPATATDEVHVKAKQAFARGNCEDAIALCREGLALAEDPRLHWVLGKCHMQQGDNEESIAAFRRVLKSSSASAHLRMNAGEHLREVIKR